MYDVGWLVVLSINVDLAIFQPYLDLKAGDNQSLKIQVARPGIEPRSSSLWTIHNGVFGAPNVCNGAPIEEITCVTLYRTKTFTFCNF